MPHPMFEEQRRVEKHCEVDTLRRGLMAQLDLAGKTGEKLVEEYRERMAETLMLAGVTLIPCDHLLDHQYAVSRGVYEAAKRRIAR